MWIQIPEGVSSTTSLSRFLSLSNMRLGLNYETVPFLLPHITFSFIPFVICCCQTDYQKGLKKLFKDHTCNLRKLTFSQDVGPKKKALKFK